MQIVRPALHPSSDTRRLLLPLLLALLPACEDFSLSPAPEKPARPTVESVEPLEAFAGQQVRLTGTLFDAGSGETPQVFVANVQAIVVGAVDTSQEKQVATIEIPEGLPFGTDLSFRVHTSAGDGSLEIAGSRYLGLGRLPETGTAQLSRLGASPWGLAVSEELTMSVDWWRNRLNVFDALGERTQTFALRVGSVARAEPIVALLGDVALSANGRRALIAYTAKENVDQKEVVRSGLVALAACEGGWVPSRHYQLAPEAGQLLRLVYVEEQDAFFGVRSGGVGGLVRVEADSLPEGCLEACEGACAASSDPACAESCEQGCGAPCAGERASRARLGIAPDTDPTWRVAELTHALPEEDLVADPGLSVSADGKQMAVSRMFELGSTIDVYGIDGANPPVLERSLSFLGEDKKWIMDVVLWDREGQGTILGGLDWDSSKLLLETAPGVDFGGRSIDTGDGAFSLFHLDDSPQLFASTLNALVVVDLEQGRATGHIATPGTLARMVAVPGGGPLAYGSMEASEKDAGALLVINRDALLVTKTWQIDYPLQRVAYSTEMDTFLGSTVPEYADVFVGAGGARYATQSIDFFGRAIVEVDTVAADRDMLAVAGRRLAGTDVSNFVMLLRNLPSSEPPVSGSSMNLENRPFYISAGEGRYVGLAPYRDGLIGLKRDSFERIGTGECDQRNISELVLPASCTVGLPEGYRIQVSEAQVDSERETRNPIFAVTETGFVLVPQAVPEGTSATRIAARIPVAGGAPEPMFLDGEWLRSEVAASRDGSLIAINAYPPCTEEQEDALGCTPGTAFYAFAPPLKDGMEFLEIPALKASITSVAVSPDGSRIYLGTYNGRLFEVTPRPEGVSFYRDMRLIAALEEDEPLSALSISRDGESIVGMVKWPINKVVVLQ